MHMERCRFEHVGVRTRANMTNRRNLSAMIKNGGRAEPMRLERKAPMPSCLFPFSLRCDGLYESTDPRVSLAPRP